MVWAVSLSSAELSPDVLTAISRQTVFVVCERWVPVKAPVVNRALPPFVAYMTLALKLFRGEPAISKFDWHFTANHSSSKHFAACSGAVLTPLLRGLQTGHG